MITPIQSIFASETSNKLNLTDSQIANGIQYQSSVVSNQLNAIANRTDIMIDDLQRSVAFYNNQKQYRKNNLCKLLVKYNGIYGIVTLAWNNITMGNQSPFIEVESTPSLEFTYNYNNCTPILTINTIDKQGFFLKEFLNTQYWDIVAISSNFQKLNFTLGNKEQAVVKWTHNGVAGLGSFHNKQIKCEIGFNIFDYDFLYFIADYFVNFNGSSGAGLITPAFLRACKTYKIPYCVASNVFWVNNIADSGSFVFADFDLWNLEKNIIYLRGSWNFYDENCLHIYGIKL